MAFRHGKNAQISVNAVDLSTFCTNLDLEVDVDTADTTTFGSTWKTALAGIPGAKMEITGDFDPTASTGPASAIFACITGGVPVAVVHKPGGTLSGQRTNSFNAIVTGYSESSPVGGIVTFKSSLLVTGAVTPTTQ
jgi:predicted secreted protein